MRTALASIAVVFVLAIISAGLFVASGAYDVGADTPHSPATRATIELFRDRSIAVCARSVNPPNLADERLVLKGAGQYAAMCANCHLAPGIPAGPLSPTAEPLPVPGRSPDGLLGREARTEDDRDAGLGTRAR